MLVAVINGNDGERMLNDVERVLGHCKNNDHLILLIRHSKLRQMHSEGKRAESWRVLEFILNEVYSCAFAYNQTFRSTNPLDWPAIDVVVDGTCGYDVFEKFADSCDWFLSDPGDIARLPLGNYKLIKDLALLPEKANSFTRKQLKNASLFEKEAKIRREIPKEFENIQIPSNHEFVVLGGTFDHFHAGHKILLSMACWLSTKSVCCGISDDKLLQNKKFKEHLEPIEQRIRSVLDFCKIFASHLAVDVVPINDIYGPTATVPSINAIVVSEESLQGGRAVNEKRRENGLNPLYIYVIDVISGVVSDGKLGSTNLRQLVAERNGLK